MNIESVVERLTAVRARCLSGYPDVYGVNGVDLQALLDAYRDSMVTQEAWRKSSLHRLDEVMALNGERDALKEENARLLREFSSANRDLGRAQELLASARAQGEAHLQARLEAERNVDTLTWSRDFWKEHQKQTCAKLSKTWDRFRRLARRYLGLRAEHVDSDSWAVYWKAECFRRGKQTEAAEQKVKELEARPSVVEKLFNECAAQSTCANAATKRADELQKRVDFLESDHAFSERWVADLQKRVDELEEDCKGLNEWGARQEAQLEAALWKNAVSGITLANRAEHAESIAMGTAFELSRALEIIEGSWARSSSWFDARTALLRMFDAPGGAK